MLARAGIASPALDAKRLTAHVLRFSDLELATRERELVDAIHALALEGMMEQRLAGRSVARIVGEREFYGLPFRLNAATLEPRPETELLVDLALRHLPPGGTLLDLGTGTGCIPVAVLANRSDAQATAVDLSGEALGAACDNAARNGVSDRIALLEGSWFTPLPATHRFDLIVSNPPYVASAVIPTLSPEVRAYDPPLALDGGPDGLAPYRVIAAEAAGWLRPGGAILVEIGFDQGAAVAALFAQARFGTVLEKDLNGLDRVIIAHQM